MFATPQLLCHGSVLAEHHALQTTVGRMRGLCRALACDRKPSLAAIRRLLGKFSTQLLSNFATEEGDDYFESLVRARPAFDSRVAHLHAEHVQLTKTVDTLQHCALGLGRDPELGLLLGRTLDRFQAHERSENLLLQEFFLLDEGGEGEGE